MCQNTENKVMLVQTSMYFHKNSPGTLKGVLWFIYYKHHDTVNTTETSVSCMHKFKMRIFNNKVAL